MTHPRKWLPLIVAVALALIAAGCGSTASEVARTAAQQGRPCEAAELEPRYEHACTEQKNAEAAEREARDIKEAAREAERLAK